MRLWDGVFVRSWVWGGAWRGGSRRVSKILDLVSHRAAVTGEWYIPGHRLRGFLSEPKPEPEGMAPPPPSVFCASLSNGFATVPTTGIGAVKLEAMENFFSLPLFTFLLSPPCQLTTMILGRNEEIELFCKSQHINRVFFLRVITN